MLRDVKKVDKAILSTFSKQVDEVRVDEMDRVERLFARYIALITLGNDIAVDPLSQTPPPFGHLP